MFSSFKKINIAIGCLLLTSLVFTEKTNAQQEKHYDICIYGATSSGVIAAYTAKELGKSVILIEPTTHLGGLTSGGLGYTDIGNKYVVTGLANDFYRKVGNYYGRLEQWTFEPKIAKEIFEEYLRKAKVSVMYQRQLVAVQKNGTKITGITLEDSEHPGSSSYEKVIAKEFLDCTYEGDLMAKANVSYTTGREANSQYGETYNGVQLMTHHQFPDNIDPYKIAGDSASGLLWGISNEKLLPPGTGDKKIQAYNIRICLTTDTTNMIPITRPANYDSTHYELLLRWLKKYPAKSINAFLIISKMPNHKTDINNNGAFSTDMIGENWDYPDADYATRKKIQTAHDDYTKGFLYFVGHDTRVPSNLRDQMLQYGYPKDEYINNNHWTPQMYVREARRMIGNYVMTQANCIGKTVASDGIGFAAYTMDSHNCDRLVVNGMVKNEGNVEIGGFAPYPISYGALVPKAAECTNLAVPVCLSASHIAYGSIRMEPVFMVLGQVAATAAVKAIDENINIQDVSAKAIQETFKNNPYADGRMADIIVDNQDSGKILIHGQWKISKHGGYGPDFLISNKDSAENAYVQFFPAIKENGTYELYTYFPKVNNIASKTIYKIYDGSKTTFKTIDKSSIKVLGQTSGEWAPLGNYKLRKGRKCFVEISNGNTNNIVAADAILCIRKNK